MRQFLLLECWPAGGAGFFGMALKSKLVDEGLVALDIFKTPRLIVRHDCGLSCVTYSPRVRACNFRYLTRAITCSNSRYVVPAPQTRPNRNDVRVQLCLQRFGKVR